MPHRPSLLFCMNVRNSSFCLFIWPKIVCRIWGCGFLKFVFFRFHGGYRDQLGPSAQRAGNGLGVLPGLHACAQLGLGQAAGGHGGLRGSVLS